MRILLADDHELVSAALSALLKKSNPDQDIQTVTDLESVFEALRQDQAFDIIVLDLRMPGMNGLTGARKVVAAYPAIPVMILSGALSYSDVQVALEMGVKGLVTKNMSGAALSSAIAMVAAGEVFVPTSLMVQHKNRQAGAGPIGQLTGREIDVLGQLRHGGSNKEIASTLSIQESTVKLHLKSICEKLQARNRTDIVVKAIEYGLA